jgi:hypothetical protein
MVGRIFSVGPGGEAGGAGGDVEGDEAFADAGIADEERDFSDRYFFRPEPLNGLGGVVVGAKDFESVGW